MLPTDDVVSDADMELCYSFLASSSFHNNTNKSDVEHVLLEMNNSYESYVGDVFQEINNSDESDMGDVLVEMKKKNNKKKKKKKKNNNNNNNNNNKMKNNGDVKDGHRDGDVKDGHRDDDVKDGHRNGDVKDGLSSSLSPTVSPALLSPTATAMEQKDRDRSLEAAPSFMYRSDEVTFLHDLPSTIDNKEMELLSTQLHICIVCSEKDEEIVDLKKKGALATERLTKARGQRNTLQTSLDYLKIRMEAMESKMDVLTDSNIKLTNSNIKLIDSNLDLNTSVNRLTTDNNALKKSFTAVHRMSLRLLIYDARNYIVNKVG